MSEGKKPDAEYTPLFHTLLSNPKIGIHGAAIFGRVWRYCQAEKNVCYAKQETIAAELGINRATVNRNLRVLVGEGFLKDLTPERKNHSHSYKLTGKHCNLELQQSNLELQCTVTLEHTNKRVTKESKNNKKKKIVFSKEQNHSIKRTLDILGMEKPTDTLMRWFIEVFARWSPFALERVLDIAEERREAGKNITRQYLWRVLEDKGEPVAKSVNNPIIPNNGWGEFE